MGLTNEKPVLLYRAREGARNNNRHWDKNLYKQNSAREEIDKKHFTGIHFYGMLIM
jgi:hypothetical protein